MGSRLTTGSTITADRFPTFWTPRSSPPTSLGLRQQAHSDNSLFRAGPPAPSILRHVPVTTAEIATRGVILRGSVGSTAHGLHLAGTDDRDEMGIAVEPPERVIGLTEFEQHIHRTAEERLKHNPSADQ